MTPRSVVLEATLNTSKNLAAKNDKVIKVDFSLRKGRAVALAA